MREPWNACCILDGPGSVPPRAGSGEQHHFDDSERHAAARGRRLAALQRERQELSRLLRQLLDAAQQTGTSVKGAFLDAWCWRVMEIEFEMDRLREALPDFPGEPPLEVRLIRQLFTAHRGLSAEEGRDECRDTPTDEAADPPVQESETA